MQTSVSHWLKQEHIDEKTIVVFLGRFGKAFGFGDLKFSSNEKYSRFKHKYPTVLSRGWTFSPEAKLDETLSEARTRFRENHIQQSTF